VIPAARPLAEASKRLVEDIRALDAPLELGVTGQTAESSTSRRVSASDCRSRWRSSA
jgi:hypothetical protein